jgi:hypothetical protein
MIQNTIMHRVVETSSCSSMHVSSIDTLFLCWVFPYRNSHDCAGKWNLAVSPVALFSCVLTLPEDEYALTAKVTSIPAF